MGHGTLGRGTVLTSHADPPLRAARVSELANTMADVPEALIDVRNLSFRYPNGAQALHGIDFVLRSGETVAVFGANGSGKTTFLSHLVGLLHGEGSITICGLPVNGRNLAEVRRRVCMLFQDSDDQILMPTIEEDVAFGPLNLGLDARVVQERTDRCLAQVGLDHLRDRPPHLLSAGQRRRVALAGALAVEPYVLLLDEPATFLDPPGRRALVRTLRELPQAKILVTHEVELAAALADRAVFFEDGQIVADGPVADIASRYHWR